MQTVDPGPAGMVAFISVDLRVDRQHCSAIVTPASHNSQETGTSATARVSGEKKQGVQKWTEVVKARSWRRRVFGRLIPATHSHGILRIRQQRCGAVSKA